jgi:hypothetical protein
LNAARPLKLAALAAVALLLIGGCARRVKPPAAPPAAVAAVAPGMRGADGTLIEALPFRQGVSSMTVERLGKQQACVSREGASLVTEPGPVEVYKMVCESGRVFMARCELRQCRAM